jgi:adenosylhomocysteinase
MQDINYDIRNPSLVEQGQRRIEWALHKGNSTNSVHNVPIEIDDEISRLKLRAMNIRIDQLTDAQIRYLSSWQEGT